MTFEVKKGGSRYDCIIFVCRNIYTIFYVLAEKIILL